jgi:hypothetical protein
MRHIAAVGSPYVIQRLASLYLVQKANNRSNVVSHQYTQ